MKTIILYKSKTGYTKTYAEMLSKSLNCEAIDLKTSGNVNLSNYDTILFGGSVMASNINGFKKVIGRLKPLKDKNIVLFAVGANGNTKQNLDELRKKNLEPQGVIYPLFYLQGGFDPEKLSFMYRIMLTNVAKGIKKRQDKNPSSLSDEDQMFLDFFYNSHYDVNEDNTKELVEYIQSLQ